MASTLKLAPKDRDFFGLVSQAASCNPFSDERLEIDRKIAGALPDAPVAERVEHLVAVVSERVKQLESHQSADIRRYSAEEREMVRDAVLFDLYHRYMTAFDQLILEQVEAGDESVPVPFAQEAIAFLTGHGFGRDDAVRYLAILYQIRRAYYFIDAGLVGCSECMKQLRRHLWNNVFTHDIRLYERHLWNRMEDFSTMLLGETGTGKGTAAAAIGRSGFIPFDEKRGAFAQSFTSSFTALNLSQFPETLIESELFGHRKGAFTGAVEAHEGIFARCSSYGAIFLDEIGDASVPVQIKLLQVLQERTFTPVGSHEKLRFRGRVIAATNKPLDELRQAGEFRDDFFYRLCSDVITVPSLRQRIADDPQELDDLTGLILQRLTGSADEEMFATVRGSLDKNYPWPGNVRELEQAVRRILLKQEYTGDHKAVAPDIQSKLLTGIRDGNLDADALLAGYCGLLYERHSTIEEVARRTNLDRRTVKAYLAKHQSAAVASRFQ
jgi:DNA-binding NtrC family response regulator